MLKGLIQFRPPFDIIAFLMGKDLIFVGRSIWKDFETKAILGYKYELVIARDGTVYKLDKNGQQITNLYEKLVVKTPKNIDIPIGSAVTLVNPAATLYGEFSNQLSIKADDIKVVTPAPDKQ